MAILGGCNNEQTGFVNDAVCFTVDLAAAADAVVVWTDGTPFVINGTIMVENNGIVAVAPTVTLEVNGVAVPDFTVPPGESRSITLNDINSIGIVGTGGTSTGNIVVSFSLNYQY
ncbi:DUF3992 domain-containing protein [Bacillus zhangzhouensis]|uniref:Endospore appendages core domain-containing protein n=1 Tax=Bacillus zhangzhouensis TaxID=1178540 RepID=A0A081L7T8_9BACI|nr:S-Ena type endospore appendage [Bacillus zhangzhouensis]KEP25314.1 hypothetical protein BA70_09365 [Bacillus zhangzhouensis]